MEDKEKNTEEKDYKELINEIIKLDDAFFETDEIKKETEFEEYLENVNKELDSDNEESVSHE